MDKIKIVSTLLRIGLAFIYLYAAVSAFISPNDWIGFLPSFMRQFVPANILLLGFSLYQIILGLWLLSGKKTVFPALLSVATQAGILIFNLGAMEIVFRDVGLLFASLALLMASV